MSTEPDLREGSQVKVLPAADDRTGRWTRLVPLSEGDDFLYALAANPAAGFRWRYHGTVPSLDAFRQSLWGGVLTQFIVEDIVNGTKLGLVVAYNGDLHNGHVYLGAVMHPDVTGSGVGIDAADTFVRHLFRTYNLRKIYLDVPEYNIDSIGSITSWLCHEEGRLLDHTYYSGQYWDRITLAIYRDEYTNMKRTPLGRRRRR